MLAGAHKGFAGQIERSQHKRGTNSHGGEVFRRGPDRLPCGTEVAALFYSRIESAKLCGVEPKRYLLTATRAALADRAAVTLPRDLLASS